MDSLALAEVASATGCTCLVLNNGQQQAALGPARGGRVLALALSVGTCCANAV